MQPRRQRTRLVADPSRPCEIRLERIADAAGSLTAEVSRCTAPLSSTTQIAVSSIATSRPQKNSIKRLPRVAAADVLAAAATPTGCAPADSPASNRLRVAFSRMAAQDTFPRSSSMSFFSMTLCRTAMPATSSPFLGWLRFFPPCAGPSRTAAKPAGGKGTMTSRRNCRGINMAQPPLRPAGRKRQQHNRRRGPAGRRPSRLSADEPLHRAYVQQSSSLRHSLGARLTGHGQ